MNRILLVFVTLVIFAMSGFSKTYYSYQSGNFNVSATWTTDPSGTLYVNIGAATPGISDTVVVLNGRTITTVANTTLSALTINEGGIFDLATFTSHNIGTVTGRGTLKLSSNTFPTGTFTQFVSSAGGTVEYYNLDGVAISTTQLTYNNLTLSNTTANNYSVYLNNSTDGITYTLNGNFELKKTSTGTLTFNYGNPTPLDNLITMSVFGNYTVGEGCNIRVNNFASNAHSFVGSTDPMPAYPVHTLNIYGDLTNNGSIRFTGLTSTTDPATLVAYYSLTNNRYNSTNYGAVQVYFKGATNNTLTCGGITDFFRMVIEKGTDQTYTLELNSTNINNFALYAPNYQGASTKTGGLPENLGWGNYYKALFIHYGTLKLNDNINIPSLTEGGLDFNIFSTAQLWVNGATVSTTISGRNAPTFNSGSYQALTLVGNLRISAGQLSTGDATGIVLHKNGTPLFQIEETGVLDVSEFWVDKTGTNLMSYIQTGGTVNVRMLGQQQDGPMMDLSNPATVFKMSGGTLNFTNNVLYNYDATPILNQYRYYILDIRAQSGNYEVTGGIVNFNLPGSTTSYTANSTAPFYDVKVSRRTGGNPVTIQWLNTSNTKLEVYNDLTLEANTTLNLETNLVNLNVGGDFTINAGAIYTPGNTTLTFNGFEPQTMANAGTITSNLNNLILDKTAYLNLGSNLTLRGNLEIGKGTSLRDNNFTLSVAGNISNSGTHYRPAAGGGSIILSGGNNQTITGDGTGSFNNLSIDKSAGSVALTSNMQVTGNLRLISNHVLSIASNTLILGANAIIYSSTGIDQVFSGTKMIRTSGLYSDGGVKKTFSNTSEFVFPYGFNSGGTNYYMPAFIQFSSAPTTYGSVQSRPADERHHLAQGSNNALTTFWKNTATGFVGIPINSVNHRYFYDYSASNFFVPVPANEVNYVRARYENGTTWQNISNGTQVDETTNQITFSGLSTVTGEFTAGETSAFSTIPVLYSSTNGNWESASSWSTTAVGGTGGGGVPGPIQ